MRDTGELLEWAEVHGNFYGTPRAAAEEAMQEGRDMLFDIDWQGALQLQEQAKADIVSIFILPPSMRELKRAKRRAEDSARRSAVRLKNAAARSSAGGNTTTSSSTTTSTGLSRRCGRSSRRTPAARPAPGLFDFTENLLGEGAEQLLKQARRHQPRAFASRTNSDDLSVSARRVGSIPPLQKRSRPRAT